MKFAFFILSLCVASIWSAPHGRRPRYMPVQHQAMFFSASGWQRPIHHAAEYNGQLFIYGMPMHANAELPLVGVYNIPAVYYHASTEQHSQGHYHQQQAYQQVYQLHQVPYAQPTEYQYTETQYQGEEAQDGISKYPQAYPHVQTESPHADIEAPLDHAVEQAEVYQGEVGQAQPDETVAEEELPSLEFENAADMREEALAEVEAEPEQVADALAPVQVPAHPPRLQFGSLPPIDETSEPEEELIEDLFTPPLADPEVLRQGPLSSLDVSEVNHGDVVEENHGEVEEEILEPLDGSSISDKELEQRRELREKKAQRKKSKKKGKKQYAGKKSRDAVIVAESHAEMSNFEDRNPEEEEEGPVIADEPQATTDKASEVFDDGEELAVDFENTKTSGEAVEASGKDSSLSTPAQTTHLSAVPTQPVMENAPTTGFISGEDIKSFIEGSESRGIHTETKDLLTPEQWNIVLSLHDQQTGDPLPGNEDISNFYGAVISFRRVFVAVEYIYADIEESVRRYLTIMSNTQLKESKKTKKALSALQNLNSLFNRIPAWVYIGTTMLATEFQEALTRFDPEILFDMTPILDESLDLQMKLERAHLFLQSQRERWGLPPT